jgi:hypothetical protein
MLRESKEEKALALYRDMMLFYREGYKQERKEMIRHRLIGQSGCVEMERVCGFILSF